MKKSQVFQSNRNFIVVSYSTSHGLLLIRSRKTNEYPKRIEILFQDVRAIELRFWFDGVLIEEVDQTFLAHFQSKPTQMVEPGNKIYCIKGNGWMGYIVGGIFRTVEDDGDFNSPSSLL